MVVDLTDGLFPCLRFQKDDAAVVRPLSKGDLRFMRGVRIAFDGYHAYLPCEEHLQCFVPARPLCAHLFYLYRMCARNEDAGRRLTGAQYAELLEFIYIDTQSSASAESKTVLEKELCWSGYSAEGRELIPLRTVQHLYQELLPYPYSVVKRYEEAIRTP